jgi:hypothetical protein
LAGAKEGMIVAIQQPEHLPWVGFFNKMSQSGLYVLLDNVQFKKRYFENRNRVKTKDGIKWLTVPVVTKSRYTQKINEVVIDNTSSWSKKYKGTIEHAYKKSPFYQDVGNIIYPCLEKNHDKLVDLNIELISRLRNYLKITTPVICASSLGVDGFKGSDLLLEICLKINAKVYISGPDGIRYLKINDFKSKDINIVYHEFKHPVYPQQFGDFVPYMSVIDLIANCGTESIDIVKNCYRTNLMY